MVEGEGKKWVEGSWEGCERGGEEKEQCVGYEWGAAGGHLVGRQDEGRGCVYFGECGGWSWGVMIGAFNAVDISDQGGGQTRQEIARGAMFRKFNELVRFESGVARKGEGPEV